MISRQVAEECLAKLGMLRHFPTRVEVVAEVGRFLNELCSDDEQARKITAEVLNQFSEWPGPLGLKSAKRSLTPVNTMDPETRKRIEKVHK